MITAGIGDIVTAASTSWRCGVPGIVIGLAAYVWDAGENDVQVHATVLWYDLQIAEYPIKNLRTFDELGG